MSIISLAPIFSISSATKLPSVSGSSCDFLTTYLSLPSSDIIKPVKYSSPSSRVAYPPIGTWQEPSMRFKRSEEHTSELQSRFDLVCRLLLEKKKNNIY